MKEKKKKENASCDLFPWIRSRKKYSPLKNGVTNFIQYVLAHMIVSFSKLFVGIDFRNVCMHLHNNNNILLVTIVVLGKCPRQGCSGPRISYRYPVSQSSHSCKKKKRHLWSRTSEHKIEYIRNNISIHRCYGDWYSFRKASKTRKRVKKKKKNIPSQ